MLVVQVPRLVAVPNQAVRVAHMVAVPILTVRAVRTAAPNPAGVVWH